MTDRQTFQEASKASLVVITDEFEDDLNDYCFLIKYTSKKLNSLGIVVSKTFFITRHDYQDIVRQVNYLVTDIGNSLNWLIVTTTKPKFDPILRKLLDDMRPKPGETEILTPTLTLYRQFLFLVNCERFFDNFALAVSRVMVSQPWRRVKFLFEDKRQQDAFLANLDKETQIEISAFKSSYSRHAVELSLKTCLKNSPAMEKIDYNLNNNYTNADNLVYNFPSSCHGLDHSAPDLKFLVKKIDLEKMRSKIIHSISVIERTLKQSESSQVCISFNGGKDCCVVLYLYFACALRLGYKFPLNVVIIKIDNSFTEMDEFMLNELKQFYRDSLDYTVLADTSKTLKQSLFELKTVKPQVNYILMGTRRTDGSYFINMPEFAPTDPDWPSFVRVNPILDWTYGEIWYFIRALKLPYCELYDRGYTSIDTRLNTVPNQALFDAQRSLFLPAYYLDDDSQERLSRVKPTTK